MVLLGQDGLWGPATLLPQRGLTKFGALGEGPMADNVVGWNGDLGGEQPTYCNESPRRKEKEAEVMYIKIMSENVPCLIKTLIYMPKKFREFQVGKAYGGL